MSRKPKGKRTAPKRSQPKKSQPKKRSSPKKSKPKRGSPKRGSPKRVYKKSRSPQKKRSSPKRGSRKRVYKKSRSPPKKKGSLKKKGSPKPRNVSPQPVSPKDKPVSQKEIIPKFSPLNKYQYIKYPVTLSEHYSSKYNKNIYVFGDIHVKKAKCPKGSTNKNTINFIDFLSTLPQLRNPDGSPKLIDYFLEVGFRSKVFPSKASESYKGYFDPLYNILQNCLRIEKEVCQYKNVRFQYSDIRSIPYIHSLLDLHYFFSYIYENRTSITKIQNNGDIRHYRKKLTDGVLNSFKDWKNFLETAKILGKVNKQLQALEFPEVEKQIVDQIQHIYLSELKDLDYNFIERVIKIYDDNVKLNSIDSITMSKIGIFGDRFIDAASSIMDLYLLARMFRKFRKVPGVPSEPPTNIIVYVGNWHAENYRKFLNSLGFTSKTTSSMTLRDSYQCVNLNTFYQPFFGKYDLQPNQVYLPDDFWKKNKPEKKVDFISKKISTDNPIYNLRKFIFRSTLKNMDNETVANQYISDIAVKRKFYDVFPDANTPSKSKIAYSQLTHDELGYDLNVLLYPEYDSSKISNSELITKLFDNLTFRTSKGRVKAELDDYKSEEYVLDFYIPFTHLLNTNLALSKQIDTFIENKLTTSEAKTIKNFLLQYKLPVDSWSFITQKQDISNFRSEAQKYGDTDLLSYLEKVEKAYAIIDRNEDFPILFFGNQLDLTEAQGLYNRQISGFIYDAIQDTKLRDKFYDELQEYYGTQSIDFTKTGGFMDDIIVKDI